MGETFKSFMLHYNFPPYSVERPGRLGDRAGGKSATAPWQSGPLPRCCLRRRSSLYHPHRLGDPGVQRLFFHATVCGASMALMDAGVPIKSAVARGGLGLIKENDRVAVLSDILGDEDALGDMDFRWPAPPKGSPPCRWTSR